MAEIWRNLSAQQADTRRLADPIWSEQADDLALLRDRETEEAERVLSILVNEIFLKRLGETDDPNCIERTFADADSATYASFFADRGLRGLRIDPDDLRAGPLRWAEGDALEMAALGLTSILEHDRDPHDEFDEA